MTKQEFETRVKMSVSDKEYMAINEVYNNSDIDKDEFCKMWGKMNHKRVATYLAEEKERKRMEAIKDKAFAILVQFGQDTRNYSKLAVTLLSARQRTFCESLGIEIKETVGNTYSSTSMSTVLFELQKAVGLIR